jgi:hypothetical protein
MWHILNLLPEVEPARSKEPHFFIGHGSQLARYLGLFAAQALARSPAHVAVDGSASTVLGHDLRREALLANSTAAAALTALVPGAKVVLLLREPASAVWSYFRFRALMRPGPTASVADYERETPEAVARLAACLTQRAARVCVSDRQVRGHSDVSLYLFHGHLQALWRHVAVRDTFVLGMDDLREPELWADLLAFLQLAPPTPAFLANATSMQRNMGHGERAESKHWQHPEALKWTPSAAVQAQLQAFYRQQAPQLQALLDLAGYSALPHTRWARRFAQRLQDSRGPSGA